MVALVAIFTLHSFTEEKEMSKVHRCRSNWSYNFFHGIKRFAIYLCFSPRSVNLDSSSTCLQRVVHQPSYYSRLCMNNNWLRWRNFSEFLWLLNHNINHVPDAGGDSYQFFKLWLRGHTIGPNYVFLRLLHAWMFEYLCSNLYTRRIPKFFRLTLHA